MATEDWSPEAQLRMRVDEVLHYLWDPVGISDAPEARDEYYGYSAHAFIMLKDGAKANDVAEYLRKVRIEHMEVGRGADQMTEEELSEVLVRWKESLLDS